jgi:hypothetical protein
MITAAEHIRRRTRKEVRPKFEAAGQARALLSLLREKFGPLPPKLVARVKRATTETLEGWFSRLLKANLLDDVFAEG